MRTIKFRVWDHVDKAMISGDIDSSLYFPSFDPELKVGRFLENGDFIDDLRIMQFTGLHDKDGKEIYEGDVYQVAGNITYLVQYFEISEHDFEKAYACFCLTIPERITIPFDEWSIKHGKVIGNIHQNPELLK